MIVTQQVVITHLRKAYLLVVLGVHILQTTVGSFEVSCDYGMYIILYVCAYVCMCVCMYACMYVCMYVYIIMPFTSMARLLL